MVEALQKKESYGGGVAQVWNPQGSISGRLGGDVIDAI
jgi:hypothetical protein